MENNVLIYIENLKNMAINFLAGNIDAEDFAFDYENYLVENMDDINNYNPIIYDYLADIQTAIAYFEPVPEHRSLPCYTDEPQFRKKVQEALNKLENIKQNVN